MICSGSSVSSPSGYSGRAFGQVGDEHVGEHVELEAGHRGDRHHVGPVAEFGNRHQLLGDPLRRGLSVLVTTTTTGVLRDACQLAGQEPVAGADRVSGRDAEPDHVHLGQGGADQAVQALAEQRPRPVQAGRVHEDQLGVRAVHDAADHPPGGLRPVAGDRHLGADQRVRQSRLADVRTAGEAGEARRGRQRRRRPAGEVPGGVGPRDGRATDRSPLDSRACPGRTTTARSASQ